LRKKIKHFIQTGKIEDAKSLLKDHFPELFSMDKTIECSLASLQFIQCIHEQNTKNAIDLLLKEPLNSNQL